MSTVNNHSQSSFAFAPHLREARRHSAAPFSLTAILPSVESPTFNEHDTSMHFTTQSRPLFVKESGYETILHKMGRKLTSFLPKHEQDGTLRSLRIPMQTEIQVVRESNSDDGQGFPWRKSSAGVYPTANNVYGNGPSMSFVSTSSSLGQRRTKRKPTPIFVPDSSDVVNTCIEQVYSSGEKCEANKYSSHAMRGRSYSVPSAASDQSFPSSPPLRQLIHEETTQRSIKLLPPPIPPRSPRRMVPPPTPPLRKAVNPPRNQAVHLTHARTHSLSTMVKALFGASTNNGTKKTVVLLSRTSSLKRMKSKASISTSSPTKKKFKSHRTGVAAILNGRGKTVHHINEMTDNSTLPKLTSLSERKRIRSRRQKNDGSQSFLSISPLSSRE